MNVESGSEYRRSDVETQYLKNLYAEPNREKQLAYVSEQIKAINALDWARLASIKSQKAFIVLQKHFGMQNLTIKLRQGLEKRSLVNDVKETLGFLKTIEEKLQGELKGSEE